MLKEALKYLEGGCSIIPVRSNKKPYLHSWEPYQHTPPTIDEVTSWWTKWPQANIAVVTGAVSQLTVLDLDSQKSVDELKKVIDTPKTPAAKTQRGAGGYHLYFNYQEGLSNKSKAFGDCDIRNDGGYIIVPPSVGEKGSYSWINGFSLFDLAPISIPSDLLYILYNTKDAIVNIDRVSPNRPQVSPDVLIDFTEGSRDNSLFHIGCCLSKGHMDIDNIAKCLHFFGSHCNPPFPAKEVEVKVRSVHKRLHTNISEEVRSYTLSTNGIFTSLDVVQHLQMSSRQDRKNISQALARLVEESIIERTGNRNGQFRRVESEVKPMNLDVVTAECADLWLPFDIHNYVETDHGGIILVAGAPNGGKTAFLLNIIRYNMFKYETHYFNSEMGASELKKRLTKFDDIDIEDWKFHAYERPNKFADVIRPGQGVLNIIDFLEVYDNFFAIGQDIADIHKKLNGAIAIISVQKPRGKGRDTGRGGDFTLEKPRLALSIDAGRIKIVKAKAWVSSDYNPNGLMRDFKLYSGCKFEPMSGWYSEERKA